MTQFTASALSVAFAALLISVWLRSVAHRRGTPALARAKSHSFWCALIAFFASTSWDLSSTWILSPEASSESSGIDTALSAGIWVTLIYLIGLFTWPKGLQPVRTASLEARTVATPFPQRLGIFVGVLMLGAIALLWPVSQVAGRAPIMRTTYYGDFDGPSYSESTQVEDGWEAGSQVFPVLASALAGILVAVIVLSVVILNRKPLAGLSFEDNQALRTVWLNRLLRNAGILLVVLCGSAIDYAEPVLGNSWAPATNYVALGIGLLLFFWGPKVPLSQVEERHATTGFTRMRDHSLAVSFVATAFLIISVMIIESFKSWESEVAGESAALLLTWGTLAVICYLLISAAFALYADLMARRGGMRPRNIRNLPLWVYTVAGLCVATGMIFLYAPEALGAVWVMRYSSWGTTVITVALLVAGAAYFWWVRQCRVPWNVTSEQEIWYRQVLEFRGLRILSSAFILLPVWAYTALPGLIVLGLVLFCVPAFVVVNRPNVRMSPSFTA